MNCPLLFCLLLFLHLFFCSLISLFSLKATDADYLKRHSTYDEVYKAFKMAVLKVHPDKHMGDFEDHAQATEIFKRLNEAFARYRQVVSKATAATKPQTSKGGRRKR